MQDVLSLIKSFIFEMGGQLAPNAVFEEEQYYIAPAKPKPAKDEFFEIPDKVNGKYALQLFQTGISRSYLVGQFQVDNDVRPVHYASVASVVLERSEGRLMPFTRPIVADLLMCDLSGIDDNEIIERYSEGIEIIDCRGENGETGYRDRRLKAISEAARVKREMQEEGLIACVDGREEGVIILIDDSLANIDGATTMPGVVGFVPAHSEVLADDSSVLACPYKARTALDKKGDESVFYARLRDAVGSNPDHGLIRVELGAKPDGSPADEEWATIISSLLIPERYPVNPYINGWDKKIFVLQHAGEYIETLIPPTKVVTTYFGRSTA